MSFRYFCLRLFKILLFGLFNSSYVGGAAIDECAELSWQSVCICVCELPLVLCLSLPVCESFSRCGLQHDEWPGKIET